MRHTLQQTNKAVLFFNDNAAEYDSRSINAGWLAAPRALYALQAPYFAGSDKLLDLGCGTGLLSDVYKQEAAKSGHAIHVTGIDASPRMLHRAKESRYADALIELDLADAALVLPFGDQAMPHVAACGLLPYIEDLRPLFLETARILPLGGTFVFDYHPLSEKVMARCSQRGSRHIDKGTHANFGVEYYLHDEAELARLLDDAGLVVDGERKNYAVMQTTERGPLVFSAVVAMKA